jgi:hypothetical protein
MSFFFEWDIFWRGVIFGEEYLLETMSVGGGYRQDKEVQNA